MSRLLAHLADMFMDQKELLATEGLCYVLHRSKPARDALAASISAAIARTGGDGEEFELARVEGQLWASQESRPDLALYSANEQLQMYIEGKFWASLTDAQTKNYFTDLHAAFGKALVFVVPEKRQEQICSELSLRAPTLIGLSSSWVRCERTLALRDSNGVFVVVTSWSAILDVLRGVTAEGFDVRADIEQLAGLVGRMEGEGFQPLSESFLGDLELPLAVMNLVDSCGVALDAAILDRVLLPGSVRVSNSEHCMGWLALFPQAGAWIGLDFAAWRLHQMTPLWVKFAVKPSFAVAYRKGREVGAALALWEAATPRKLLRLSTGEAMVPLFVPARANADAVKGALIQQLRAIGARLDECMPVLSALMVDG